MNNNRRNILTIALTDCGYFTAEANTKSSTCNNHNDDDDEVEDRSIDNSDSDEDNYDNDPDYCDQAAYFNDTAEIEEFDVDICRDLWNKIITASTDNNNHKNLKLNKRVWTDIIAFAF